MYKRFHPKWFVITGLLCIRKFPHPEDSGPPPPPNFWYHVVKWTEEVAAKSTEICLD